MSQQIDPAPIVERNGQLETRGSVFGDFVHATFEQSIVDHESAVQLENDPKTDASLRQSSAVGENSNKRSNNNNDDDNDNEPYSDVGDYGPEGEDDGGIEDLIKLWENDVRLAELQWREKLRCIVASWTNKVEANMVKYDMGASKLGSAVVLLEKILSQGVERVLKNVNIALRPFAAWFNRDSVVNMRTSMHFPAVGLLLLRLHLVADLKADFWEDRCVEYVLTLLFGIRFSFNSHANYVHKLVRNAWDDWTRRNIESLRSVKVGLSESEMDHFYSATHCGVNYTCPVVELKMEVSKFQKSFWHEMANIHKTAVTNADDVLTRVTIERALRCMFNLGSPVLCVGCLKMAPDVNFSKNSHIISRWYLGAIRVDRSYRMTQDQQLQPATVPESMHGGKFFCDECELLFAMCEGDLKKIRDDVDKLESIESAEHGALIGLQSLELSDSVAFTGFVLINMLRIGLGDSLRFANVRCLELLLQLRRCVHAWCHCIDAGRAIDKLLANDTNAPWRMESLKRLNNVHKPDNYSHNINDTPQSLRNFKQSLENSLIPLSENLYIYVIPEDLQLRNMFDAWLIEIAIEYDIPFPVKGENIDEFGASLESHEGFCIFAIKPLIVVLSPFRINRLVNWQLLISPTLQSVSYDFFADENYVILFMARLWSKLGGPGFDGDYHRFKSTS